MPNPTVILPGYLAGAVPYRAMEEDLSALGFPAVTVPLKRSDWFPTVGGRSITPILAQLDQTVKRVLEHYGSDRINLIGHSAGGWISRIYLGDQPYSIHLADVNSTAWKGAQFVSTLVTLGTPHRSQERWTRRNLDFVNQTYPGIYHPDVRYVCVAGKAVFGQRRWGSWFAYSSYELTCGQGATWGDGITPVAAAHLDGATNLTLESVVHSPRKGKLWYGSPDILKQWVTYLE